MKIFIVGGKSGSGKSEVARFIKEFYIYKLENSVITNFSKYLKLFATEMTEWDGISENKPRDFLQNFGSIIRKDDKYFFTRRMCEDINIYALNNIDVVIISDARLPIEIEEIKKEYENIYDVYSIYIENQFSQSKLTPKQQSHITETALEEYNEMDYTIANDGTKEELHDKVFKILEGIEENGK